MRAIFRWCDEEFEVGGAGDSVLIYRRRGIRDKGIYTGNEPIKENERYVEHEEQILLSKSQARSVASAIMGAAAEL
jgi:hypothetical protein